jgi:hypothetical protein
MMKRTKKIPERKSNDTQAVFNYDGGSANSEKSFNTIGKRRGPFLTSPLAPRMEGQTENFTPRG